MIIRRRILLVLLVSLSLLNSCAYYGGGTVGTGLPLRSGVAKLSKTGVSYLVFVGKIVNATGQSVPAATVTISTPQTEESERTNSEGNFTLNVITKVGEKIEIEINSGKSTYVTSFLATGENLAEGSATFQLLGGGRIKISNLQWSQ